MTNSFFFFFGIKGGFVAGLVIPHDNGFAIALVGRFEDLVSILLLPLVRDRFRSINPHSHRLTLYGMPASHSTVLYLFRSQDELGSLE